MSFISLLYEVPQVVDFDIENMILPVGPGYVLEQKDVNSFYIVQSYNHC